jgi:uncharacterized membrane protein YeaQ/YmgE (transglycosylase-associated protein family)
MTLYERFIPRLVVGPIAGWLTGLLVGRPGGELAHMIVGAIGGLVGSWLFNALGWKLNLGNDVVESIVTVAIGSIIMVVLAKKMNVLV